jgi:hypothetical protein
MRFVGEVFLVAKIFVLINLAFSLGFWINHWGPIGYFVVHMAKQTGGKLVHYNHLLQLVNCNSWWTCAQLNEFGCQLRFFDYYFRKKKMSTKMSYLYVFLLCVPMDNLLPSVILSWQRPNFDPYNITTKWLIMNMYLPGTSHGRF